MKPKNDNMKFFLALSILIISLTSFSQNKKIDVTYIANEGFLIGTKNQQFAIDALFKDVFHDYLAPNDSMVSKIIKGQRPFDKLHLLLFTHDHQDHFNDSMVIAYLNYNRRNIIIAPSLAIDAITKNPRYKGNQNQLIGLYKCDQYKKDTIVQGLRIQSFALQHDNRPEIENLGYLIDVNGVRIIHTGDCTGADTSQFAALQLQTKNIDLAFLNFYGFWKFQKHRDFTLNQINPKKMVLMHIPPKEVEQVKDYVKNKISNFIDITVFDKSMDKKTYDFKKN
jgi:L-ascorbate metabolism protein UlaG (beta-lactamase superfamily)